MTSLHQSKSREREDFKEDEREKEPIVPRKQRNKERPDWQDDEPTTGPGEQLRSKQQNKERPDWQDDEPTTGPGEQLRPKNRGKRVYNADVKG